MIHSLFRSQMMHSHHALALFIFQGGASTIAPQADYVFYFLLAFSFFFIVLIFGLILYFMVKYRRRSEDELAEEVKVSLPLEIAWTVIPLGLCAIIFLWSGTIFFREARPPARATEIFVIGKQWMWQLQHVNGAREINELHVPLNVPVKLTMTSQDVIHDFFIPAFRIKEDVLPGRYTSLWFQATKLGTFSFRCAQFCGTAHSMMVGTVVVMKPDDYARWLSANAPAQSMSATGQKLFSQLGCGTCHANETSGKYPSLAGLYGHPVSLRNGSTATADESFLRSVIVNPSGMQIAGYAPSMPSFQGQINESELLDLIAYIKTLAPEEKETASR
ncbi:MAG TPA: cytochrome c oxidase subunit II [Candidatus Acidoferrales bacterium]|nr:cytochrome c oxidase subunit II [Candidatus Acidoferrales bacterium]